MFLIFWNDWGNDNMMNTASISIHLAPLLPWPFTLGLITVTIFLAASSCFIFRRGLVGRLLVTVAFLMIFLNPSFLEEQREPVKDTAVVVVDRSPSQNFSNRKEQTDAILNAITTQIGNRDDIDLRIVETTDKRETRLFDALDRTLSDVPVQRRAGAILITDGQVHDVPDNAEKLKDYGPVHVILSGEKNEIDRQLSILESPSYGIVGQTITVRYRVEDHSDRANGNDMATILVRGNGDRSQTLHVPVNTDQSQSFTITHAGQNIFEIESPAISDEITSVNNRMPILVNGVRDRLKVLLISGKPYPGERTWRDLLTSDPGVDLVHFTILREPEKVDVTPQKELSLIAFPFQELFEVKLYDFDLVIFDQYSLNRILPDYYFSNIAQYVQKGGALLEASGPSFAGMNSIYKTELDKILPAYPTGNVIEAPYIPTLTDLGQKHPVTQNLTWSKVRNSQPQWGPWLRQIGVQPKSGDVVMSGVQGKPLLILDHVGKGRVAQLASDQIWLWSRGYKGGGPQAELLRRLAHWLMKEPDLEENALDLISDGEALLVRRRNLHDASGEVTLHAPDGTKQSVTLKEGKGGWLESRIPAPLSGIYRVEDGTQDRFAIIGDLNPPEWRAVITTEDILKPVTQETGGTIHWITSEGLPAIRRVSGSNRTYGGFGWIGLKDNHAYSVTGMRDVPFLPAWFSAIALLAATIAAWWIEGRRRA